MPFKFLRTNFYGDPNIGLYGFATDTYYFLGLEPQKKILQKINATLKTEIIISTIFGIELSSLFSTGNSNGIILPKVIDDFELKNLKKLDLNLRVIESKETALGNLILCNDKGCLIASSLKKYKKEISDTLGCEVEIGKIAGLDIVGSCAVTNNIGCLCHREAKEEEIKKIEEILKVRVDVGSVSYGSPFIKSGIIVNSKGVVFSEQTTGAEMGRINEVFTNEE
jgi:translation initiation factor 6